MPDSGSNQPVSRKDARVSAAKSIDGESELPVHLLSKIRIVVPGYRLLEEIGRGGQAVVYKAVRNSTGEIVAIKVLHHGPFAGESARLRMQREIVALESLQHPNIVNILDSGQSPQGNDFLVMEYIQGHTLDDFIRGDRPGPAGDGRFLLTVFEKICSAMAAAHEHNITHRDLSPSNILIDKEFEPHILDFGLARTTFDDLFAQGRTEISATGQFMGKFAYASPEQVRASRGTVDSRSDVYALGIILYRIVTGGQFPYKTDGELDEVLKEILHTRPMPPSVVCRATRTRDRRRAGQLPRLRAGEVDPVLEAIILRALEKEPGKRYQQARELERDISSYFEGRPTLARPRKGWRKRKGSTVLVILTMAAIVAGVMASRKVFRRRPPVTVVSTGETARRSAPLPIPLITFGSPEIRGGHWHVEGEALVQTNLTEPSATILFGDPAWANYNLSFKVSVASMSPSSGIKVLFHWTAPDDFFALTLGNASDSRFEFGDSRGRSLSRAGRIEFGRVYDVRIEVRGPEFRCFLDGAELFHQHDDAFRNGRIGLATDHAAARFREIRVSSVDGRILWNGPPASVQTAPDVRAGVRALLEQKYRGYRETGERVEMSLDEMKKTFDNRDDKDFKVVNSVPRIRAHAAINALISLRNALADPKSSVQDQRELLQMARKTVKEALSLTDGVNREKVREYFYYWDTMLDPIAFDSVP